MRRLLPILLLVPLAAACGGPSARDLYVKRQTAACAAAQKQVAAVPRPQVPRRRHETKALQAYAIRVDRRLIATVSRLRAVAAPPSLRPMQEQWLSAVEAALEARVRLDQAPPRSLQRATRVELARRQAANALAGKLGVAGGCSLVY